MIEEAIKDPLKPEPLPAEIHSNAGQKEDTALNRSKGKLKIAPEEDSKSAAAVEKLQPFKTKSTTGERVSPNAAAHPAEMLSQRLGSSGFGGTSYLEDDVASTASFSSRMFDQFRDLDSISQLGNGEEFDESAMNLGAIKFELQARERKIRALH